MIGGNKQTRLGPLALGGGGWSQYWTTQYEAVYNAMPEKPTGLDKGVQSYLVSKLIEKSLWDKLDVVRFYGTHTNDNKEAQLDWKNPTDGDSLISDGYGNFAAGTESWLKYGGNTLVWDTDHVVATYVDNTGGVYQYLKDVASEPAVGKPYLMRARCKLVSGTASLKELYSGVSTPITSADYAWYEVPFICTNTSAIIQIIMGAGAVVHIDQYEYFECHKCVVINPAFEARNGFTGNKIDAYIDNKYNPATFGGVMAQNSASQILYLKNVTANNLLYHGAAITTATHKLALNPCNPNRSIVGINNDQTTNTPDEKYIELDGMFINTRTASDRVALFKNSRKVEEFTTASTGLVSTSIYSLANNNMANGQAVPSSFIDGTVFFEAYGAGLTDQEAIDLSDIVNQVATYLGVNAYTNDFTFEKPILVLTFDNGDNGWLDIALPTFNGKNVAGTFYAQSGQVDNPAYEPSWSDLVTMAAAGMDIQGHSKTHADFRTLTEEELIEEMTDPNIRFVANGLPAPKHHAYPSGYYNDFVISIVSQYRLTGRAYDAADSVYIPCFKYVNHYKIPSSRTDMIGFTGDEVRDLFKAKMDRAIADKGCIIGIGHSVDDGGSGTRPSDIEYWIDYAVANDMEILTMSELYDKLN